MVFWAGICFGILKLKKALLIRWASREQWKAIPLAEVARVQERFEALAREGTGQLEGNPFPLVFEGELLPQ